MTAIRYYPLVIILQLSLFGPVDGALWADERPNVILIMADDLGWGDTGYNGHPIIKTPHLDAMSVSGIRFDRFYSASAVCSPTRGSCLTGRNPYRYGVRGANQGHLKREEICLAEVLKEEGYTTGHFGKWHLGTLTPEFSGKGKGRRPQENYMTPGMSGFDEWFSTEYAVATWNPYDPANAHGRSFDVRTLYWHNGKNVIEPLSGCDSRIIMDKAIPFMERAVQAQTPFFAVIWFHAPHAPVVGGPEYRALYSQYSEDEQHYYAVVTALDEQVGRLRKTLRTLNVAENTMLWFCSDNGPEGNPDKRNRFQGTAGPFRGRKRSLYEGGVRVAGLLEWPAKIKQARVETLPCVTSDYFPTILDVLGYQLKGTPRPSDGVTLLPLLAGDMAERPRPIGFQYGSQRSLTANRYKLVYNTGKTRHRSDNGSVPFAEYELYDLHQDKRETRNIAAEHPDIVRRLKNTLHAWIDACQRSAEGEDY